MDKLPKRQDFYDLCKFVHEYEDQEYCSHCNERMNRACPLITEALNKALFDAGEIPNEYKQYFVN